MVHEIRRSIERPDMAVSDALATAPTPVLADVLERNHRVMDAAIGPVDQDSELAGPAVTVEAAPQDNLVVHRALSLAKSGDVIVVDADGYCEAGIWGEIMSLTALDRDIAGVVIDGAARDLPELRDLAFPVFARGISPKGSNKSAPGSINVSITCAGATINPGDLIVGDPNGCVSLPREELPDISTAVDEKLAAEETARELADAPAAFQSAFERVLDPLERPSDGE